MKNMDAKLKLNYWRLKYLTPKFGDREIFLLMREFLINNQNYRKLEKYVDKQEVKSIVKKWGIDTPKTLFTFNEKGEILSGSIPKDTFVFLKHNNGGGSFYVEKNVDSNTITQEYLASLWKKMNKKASKFWLRNCEPQYRYVKPQMFAEEKIGTDPFDHKIHIFNDWGYIIIQDRSLGYTREYTMDLDFNVMPNTDNFDEKFDTPPAYNKDAAIKMIQLAKVIQKELGCYIRADFYEKDGKPLLGEITFTHNAGYGYKFEGDKKLIKKWKDSFRETNKEWLVPNAKK